MGVMTMTRFFGLYGLGVTLLSSYLAYTGFTMKKADRVSNVPRSVRDNPGSYRSIYNNYHHYTGGK